MNKSQLIDTLAARFEGNRKQAAHALESVLDTITREVAKGEKVAITGFGSFEKRVRSARTVRNPATGESLRTKKKAVPKFTAGADLKNVISGAKKLPKLPAATAKKATSSTSTAKKSPAKSTAAKKTTTAKKSPAKSTAAKKTTTAKKASTAKKSPAKKASTAKASPAKKASTAKKTTAKKAPAKSTAAKKTSTAKKSTAKKTAKKS
ncbi:HU family DNA-binding protein [Nocardioides rotundus]|uniref:HU family DNA-binding protein n=1 Tax=Nocardioides rotundus TaxID=1774216 RepID=UPI001CBBF44C|nr:HU family DNA-binding protein [Nocardioides rotundus]UAL28868.1 HU family DNA-binding protein [Nocardioides rotundus]